MIKRYKKINLRMNRWSDIVEIDIESEVKRSPKFWKIEGKSIFSLCEYGYPWYKYEEVGDK